MSRILFLRDGLYFIARLVLGSVFTYSGWQKLTAPLENFSAVIAQHGLFKEPLLSWIAYSLPWTELFFGVFLALGFLVRTSALAVSILLACFIALLGRSMALRIPISDCGCFGEALKLTPVQAISFDTGLFVLAILIAIQPALRWSLDERLGRE